MHSCKRLIALLLALTMVLSCLPVPTRAEETVEEIAEEVAEEIVREEIAEEAAEETAEEIAEESVEEIAEEISETVIEEEEPELTAEAVTDEAANSSDETPLAPVQIAGGDCGDQGSNVTWSLDAAGTLTISGEGEMADYYYSDPPPWYEVRDKITTLIINEGVTSIGAYTAANCTNLTGELVIPQSVTSIGYCAFNKCSGLTGQLVLPENLVRIDSVAFSGCSGFTGDMMIPKSVTHIGDSAFYGCSGLTGNLVIPEGVVRVAQLTFCGCSGLDGSLIIPESVTEIGDEAFKGCSGLTGSLEIPKKVTSIGFSAFEGCTGLTGDLIIPDSVTTVRFSAFAGCSALNGELVLPEGITVIETRTFSNCSNLNGPLVIPQSVTSIEDYAFENCTGFTGNLIIPNGVTSIGSHAFFFCSGFDGNLVIPDNVTSIGRAAFNGCNVSGSLSLPGRLTTINGDTFACCEGLQSIHFGNVKSIGATAFFACRNLKELFFTDTVPEICEDAFYGVEATAYYPVDNTSWTEEVRRNYGGTIEWKPYGESHIHDYQPEVIQGTCQEKGYTRYSCVCGDSYDADFVYGDHDYQVTVVEPTCWEKGYTEHFCTICYDSYRDQYTQCRHDYTETVIPPTCWETGRTVHECKICYDSYEDCFVPSSHDYTHTVVKPSCVERGYTRHQCKVCEEFYDDSYSFPTGHDYEKTFVAGTEEQPGHIHYACKNCAEEYDEPFFAIPEKCDHAYEKIEYEAMCGDLSYTEYRCEKCRDSYFDNYVPVGHSYTKEVVAPTCRERGYIEYRCDNCGDSYQDNFTPVTHNYEKETVAATCTEQGYTEYRCTLCGDSYRENFVEAEGHCYGEPDLETESGYTLLHCQSCDNMERIAYGGNPDCDHDYAVRKIRGKCGGYSMTVYECGRCDAWYHADFTYRGHNYVNTVVEPNCKKQGYTQHFCLDCGFSYYDCFANGEHTMTMTVIPGSCSAMGRTEYFCVDCGRIEADTFMPAQHSYQAMVIDPTCTARGCTRHFCSKCDRAYDDTFTDPAAHSFGPWEQIAGAGREQRQCTVCGGIETQESSSVIGGECGENVTWSFDQETGTLTISGTGAMADYTRADKSPWSGYADQITDIRIEDTVTGIGAYAFYECGSAVSLTIGEGVSLIGNNAFYNCRKLETIDFNAVKAETAGSSNRIFAYAGRDGGGITVKVGPKVQRIPSYLFRGSSDDRAYLTDVCFAQNGVCTEIGAYAFYYAQDLTGINWPDNLTRIEGYAFYGCTGLTEVVIGESVTYLGGRAFYSCTGVERIFYNAAALADQVRDNHIFTFVGDKTDGTTLTIGSKVTAIPAYLFNPYSSASTYQPNIVRLEFQAGSVCRSIGTYAFAYCAQLRQIELPESLEQIKNYAFAYCYGLEKIDYRAVSMTDLYSSNMVFLAAGADGDGIAVTIGSTVERIPSCLFYPYSGEAKMDLRSVTFEENSRCTEIGSYAFCWNPGLTGIRLPDSISTVGSYAFGDCRYLTVLCQAEPATVGTDWYKGAVVCTRPDTFGIEGDFSYWNENGEAVIAKYLGSEASVTVPDTIGGCPVTKLAGSTFYGHTTLTEVALPRTLTYLGDRAFCGCESLLLLELPEPVDYVGRYCLQDTQVRFLRFSGEAPKTIDSHAFEGCTLTVNYPGDKTSWSALVGSHFGGTVTWQQSLPDCVANGTCGENVTWKLSQDGTLTIAGTGKMKDAASFHNVPWAALRSRITAAVIEEGVTHIGDHAFNSCTELLTVQVPDSLSSVGAYAFQSCKKLTGGVILPTGMEAIEYAAFRDCVSLTGPVVISEGVTRIETYAFQNCSGLTGELVIPDSVTNISWSAFAGASGLSDITFGKGLEQIGTSGYTSAEHRPFHGCTGVTRMTFTGAKPPKIVGNFLSNYNLETVYVPAASLEAYRTALAGLLPEQTRILPDPSSPLGGFAAGQVYSASALLTWDPFPGETEGYILCRDGLQIGETTDTRFVDRELETGVSYTYTVQARIGEALTEPAQLTVTTAAPRILSLKTTGSWNKLNDTKNQIFITVADSGNLLPLDDRETVLELYWGDSLIGTGLRDGRVYTVQWDISGLEEGEYPVTARLTDVDGASAGLDATVEIDRGRPAAITGLYATAESDRIQLSWKMAREVDTVSYHIYRRAEGETEFTRIHTVTGRSNCTYTDTDVEETGVYQYRVSGVSELEAEGAPSGIVAGSLVPDLIPPQINSILPVSGSTLTGSKAVLTVRAEDNLCVTEILLEYAFDGESWEELARLESGVSTFVLDTEQLLPEAEGPLHIRATATDAARNVSEPVSCSYSIDNLGPDQVTGLRWEATSVTATLRWNNVQAEDVSFFRVERRMEDGSYRLMQDVNTTLGINLFALVPGTEYTYRVTAYDMTGNRGIESEAVTVTTQADVTGPVVTRLRPVSGYYSESIPLVVEVSDDYNVRTITIQTSRDGLTWTQVKTLTYETVEARRTLEHTLDLTGYSEGELYVRAVALDSAGNESDTGVDAPFVQHMVDRQPPAVPENVRATGYQGYVEVSWNQGAEKDLCYYEVFRSEGSSELYTLYQSGLRTRNFIDRNVESGIDYSYTVRAVDQAGNRSIQSPAVIARVLEDTQPPVIRSVYPAGSTETAVTYVGSGSDGIRISAQDNSGIAFVYFAFSTDGTDYRLWQTLDAEQNADPVRLPLEQLSHGDVVHVRIQAEDKAGNRSEYATVRYQVDLLAPAVENARAEYDTLNDQVLLRWTGLGEEDLDRYRVYRSANGRESLIGYCSGENYKLESGARVYSFLDAGLTGEAVTYSYRIEAADRYGNVSGSGPLTLELPDRRVPKAVITGDGTMETGMEYVLDASRSVSNGKTLRYAWNFGDGCTGDSVREVHAYETSGVYTITLTVTDSDGLTSAVEKKITVSEPSDAGTARIQILDETGAAVAAVPVYFDLGTPEQSVKYTDSSGTVYFTAAPGSHTVGCVVADNQWLPVQKIIEIYPGRESGMAMTLVHQTLVEGEFETNRMTFEEIVAAGIDVSRPENQHLMKAEVKLAYGTSQVIQTSFIFDMNGKVVPGADQGSDGSFVVREENSSDSGERVLIPTVLNPGNTEAMTIAFLDLPVEASFLKEFFDVKLHILNNASTQFPLVNNAVTLHLPEGLSLVEGAQSENLATVLIDTINGQSSHTVNWILRGDLAGSYDLTADYIGTLDRFGTQISAQFHSAEPIRVYGTDVVKLEARISPRINYGAFYFDLTLENDSGIDVNLPNVDVMGDVIGSYLIRIEQEAQDKEDTQLTEKTPQVRHLSTLLESGAGARQSLDVNTIVTVLASGERLTKRYAVYNVTDYNNQLLLIGALEQLRQTGLRVQVVLADMDLYDTDHAANKLAALAGDSKAIYDYILDGSSFFYVQQAVGRDETLLEQIREQNFRDVWTDMTPRSDQTEAVRAITRKLVAQLLVDDTLAEAIDGHVDEKYMQLVKAIAGDIEDYLGDKGSHIQTYFQAHMGKQDTLKELAQALKHEGTDGLIRMLIRELAALGMAESDGSILMDYCGTQRLDQVQLEALRSICAGHSALVTDLTGDFAGWQRYAELLQIFLTISASYDQSIELMDMLLQNSEGVIAGEIAALREKLIQLNSTVLEKHTAKENKNNGSDPKKAVADDLTASFGQPDNVPDTFARLMFGTMMDQIAYWDTAEDPVLVMQVHNGLSMAMTALVSSRGLEAEDDVQAAYTLNALKYLIRLRLLGEQSFVFFGNSSDDPAEQLGTLEWVNTTLDMDPAFPSLDAYAAYILTLLQEYRDSIYIRGTVTEDQQLPIPQAPEVSIDYRNEQTAEAFGPEYEYSFTGDIWITGSGKPISLNPGTVSKYLWVRKKAQGSVFASPVTKVQIPARPRLLGDVTVIHDSSQFILTGLPDGSYNYQLTETTELRKLSGSFTLEDGCQKIRELYRQDIWMALQTAATDTQFASVIRYIPTRQSEYRWELNYEKGYLENLTPGTLWEEVDRKNQEHGNGKGQYKKNEKNKSETNTMGTGDEVTLYVNSGEVTLKVVVIGDVDGNALVDKADVRKLIAHVGQGGPEHTLEGEYLRAGCVSDDNGEDRDIRIQDIFAVLDSVNEEGQVAEK